MTFAMGMVAGAYFYFAGFSFKLPTINEAEVYDSFALEGKSYGACGDQKCLTFKVSYEGMYDATVGTGRNRVSKIGSLDRDLFKELNRNLTPQELRRQSQKKPFTNCDLNKDIFTQLTVTINKEEFLLDSCTTTVNTKSQAWKSIEKLQNYFITPN